MRSRTYLLGKILVRKKRYLDAQRDPSRRTDIVPVSLSFSAAANSISRGFFYPFGLLSEVFRSARGCCYYVSIAEPGSPSEDISDASLHSLLRSVAKSTSFINLELSTTWLAIGGLVSLPIVIPIAMLLYDSGIIRTTVFDRFGFIAIFSMFGFVLGALLVGTVCALAKSKRAAFDHAGSSNFPSI